MTKQPPARTSPPPSTSLARSLALHLHCRYLPTLLCKTRTTLPNKHLTRRERRSQLHDVYRLTTDPTHFQTSPLSPLTPLLLIDDILTTGTTMRALISTIRRDYPACPIKGLHPDPGRLLSLVGPTIPD